MADTLRVGFACRDITPERSLFLFGYPHVERYSTGTHDPLYASCLVLKNGQTTVALCSLDLIFASRSLTAAVREKAAAATDIPAENILVAATHTHSGPMVEYMTSNLNDPVVPPVDEAYVSFVTKVLAEAVQEADDHAEPCEIAVAEADGTGVGGNRRDPQGAYDPVVPVTAVRRTADKTLKGLFTVYCMHPTVLHEDNTLYSADFCGKTRECLEKKFPELDAYLYFTGPEGNQSPRHFIRDTTFAEAERLGYTLGERVAAAVEELPESAFTGNISLGVVSDTLDLPKRKFPPVDEAERKLKAAAEKLDNLRAQNAPYAEVRTAECDWFGAEETYTLAKLAHEGTIQREYEKYLPAEIMAVQIGGHCFVALPGEIYVEYSLRIKEETPPGTYVLCLANGTTGGYIVTPEAMAEGGYEASNALFDPRAGDVIVNAVARLVKQLTEPSSSDC